ncbi:MAG: hypothetical protein CM15mP126_2630 [Gammaproteobacteria bacterium]|nr:MAG: hypothetical protein CM15mP126_2630 [Gammaproteobacteria bacterium]
MKSHYCGEITSSNLKRRADNWLRFYREEEIRRRNFPDVRDIKGICQAVVNPDNERSFKLAESIRNEYVVRLR